MPLKATFPQSMIESRDERAERAKRRQDDKDSWAEALNQESDFDGDDEREIHVPPNITEGLDEEMMYTDVDHYYLMAKQFTSMFSVPNEQVRNQIEVVAQRWSPFCPETGTQGPVVTPGSIPEMSLHRLHF